MKMEDWIKKLDAFLQFNEYELLTNAGSISREVAMKLVEEQFARYRVEQDRRYESDFEKETKRLAGDKRKSREDSKGESNPSGLISQDSNLGPTV